MTAQQQLDALVACARADRGSELAQMLRELLGSDGVLVLLVRRVEPGSSAIVQGGSWGTRTAGVFLHNVRGAVASILETCGGELQEPEAPS